MASKMAGHLSKAIGTPSVNHNRAKAFLAVLSFSLSAGIIDSGLSTVVNVAIVGGILNAG
jgi:hypothetical protein